MPIIDTTQLRTKAPLPGWEGRFFSSENMTFGYYDMVAGASIHAHSHIQEEVWHVIEGELDGMVAGSRSAIGMREATERNKHRLGSPHTQERSPERDYPAKSGNRDREIAPTHRNAQSHFLARKYTSSETIMPKQSSITAR